MNVSTYLPIDPKVLTDEHLAILTYALESFCDNIESETDFLEDFQKQAIDLLGEAHMEYERRKLDADDFSVKYEEDYEDENEEG